MPPPAASAHPTQHPDTSTMSKAIPPAAMPLIAPATLLHAHLTQAQPSRPSGRTPTQTQPISLNIGSLTHCNGSSVVKIGNTTIICGVRAEILPITEIPSYNTRPRIAESRPAGDQSHPDGGKPKTEPYDPVALYNLVVPNIDLSTGCSPRHAPNTPPSVSTQALVHRLYALLLSTRTISASDLEILYTPPADVNYNIDPDDAAYVPDAGETKVKGYWTLYVDLMCISHGGEGGVLDAAWCAVQAALRDTLLPKAWWDADEGRVMCSPDVGVGRRLDVRSGIVTLGFGVFDLSVGRRDGVWQDGCVLLLDMDAFEEECCMERGFVAVDITSDKICRIEKVGGGSLGVQDVKTVLQAAVTRGKEWDGVLEQALSVARK